jgi:hypothetical protein
LDGDVSANTTESAARRLGRVAAFIFGIAILFEATKASIGVALFAPAGVWAADRFQRSRSRRSDAGSSWVGAVGAVVIVLICIVAIFASLVPAGTMDRARHLADSTSANAPKPPPPAWLERLSPGTAARVAAQQAGGPAPINAFTLIFGGMILIGFAGSFFGTAGWGGTMLLIFAIRGRWIGESPPVAIESHPV